MPAIILTVLSSVWSIIKPYWSQALSFIGGYRAAHRADTAKTTQLANKVQTEVAEAQAEEPKSVTDLQKNILEKGKF